MKTGNTGNDILGAEILNISPRGFWLMVRHSEIFVDFDQFPWFRKATIEQLCAVELMHQDHLYWPKLDVDLSLDCIQNPQKYPLISKSSFS